MRNNTEVLPLSCKIASRKARHLYSGLDSMLLLLDCNPQDGLAANYGYTLIPLLHVCPLLWSHV